MGFLFFKEVYQFLAIVVSGIFELFYEPLIYAIYGFFEGIDIHILFVCDGNVILVCQRLMISSSPERLM